MFIVVAQILPRLINFVVLRAVALPYADKSSSSSLFYLFAVLASAEQGVAAIQVGTIFNILFVTFRISKLFINRLLFCHCTHLQFSLHRHTAPLLSGSQFGTAGSSELLLTAIDLVLEPLHRLADRRERPLLSRQVRIELRELFDTRFNEFCGKFVGD